MFGLKPRQPLFEAGLCATVGIALADLLTGRAALVWPVALLLALAAFGAGVWSKRRAVAPGLPRLLLWVGLLALFGFWHAVRLAESPGRKLAAAIPPHGRVLSATAIVDEEPREKGRFRVRLETVTFDGGTTPSRARLLISWPRAHERPVYGDRLEFTGSARNLTRPRNPGEFDNPSIRRRQGVYSEVYLRYPRDAQIVAHHAGNPLIAASLRLRHWMEATLSRDLEDSPDVCAVITSVVLGAQADSLRDVQLLFAHTGTLHLFAVSGMNVAMIAVSAGLLLAVFRFPLRAIALTIIPLLWVYCFVTGLTASSLRATIMASITLLGVAIDRPALSWNTLGASALVILLWRPDQLFTPGFQLSFLLVAVLLAGSRPVQALFRRLGQPDPFLPRPLWTRRQSATAWLGHAGGGAFAVSLVAWVGSIPLTAYYFHLWSPSTVPANLAAGFLAWAMLMLGLASAVFGSFWGWMSLILNNANWAFSKALLSSTAFLAGLPASHFYVEGPSLSRAPFCEINLLDLAGGGAVHLRTSTPSRFGLRQERDWLLDCGSASGFEWIVAPYLRSRGVNRLDGLLLTHGDSQHLGGAPTLLEVMPVAEVHDAAYRDRSPLRRRLHTLLAERSHGKHIIRRGDRMEIAPGVVLHVLFPPTGLPLRTADDKTLILRLDLHDMSRAGAPVTCRVLFCSDGGYVTERWLLENGAREELSSDLLIKSRHAADLSGTPEFLQAVAPALIVASGADFPPQEVIPEAWAQAVEAEGIQLLRQDRDGAVRIALQADGSWEASTFLGEATFRSRAR
ncbi:MAG TPA: ComEC/Rec2 family competence protein [Chthoniobacteraceae bacterium]|nr:ComEC/Rec2 family competence protein [Chthoniobacteraceae bacterium]